MRELRAKVSAGAASAEDRYAHPNFLHKGAKAVDQRIDAGETEQPPPHRLGRSDARFAKPRLKLLNDGMRVEIEAGDGQSIGFADLEAPGASRGSLRARAREPEAIGISKIGADDRFDAAHGQKAIFGGIDGFGKGASAVTACRQARHAARGKGAGDRSRRWLGY
jgi:hypothetical protein